jgi:hypothetical protein
MTTEHFMRLPISSALAAFVAVACGALLAVSLPAAAGPISAAQGESAHEGAVELVRDGHWRRRNRGYYDDYYVDAPFTRVERRGRRVAVDAPFASVRKGRYGTWVRALFVDLYVPR